MDLQSYIAESRGRGSAIAKTLAVSPVMVSQWATEVKPVPLDRCTLIEQATAGQVMRWDLRPNDWHRIWPELIGTKGAPTPADAEAKVGD